MRNTAVSLSAENTPLRSRRFHGARTFLRHYPVGVAALLVLVMLSLVSVAAPLLAPFDPLQPDFTALKAPPSRDHWMGTDDLGRDTFSRLLYGGRVSLMIAVLAVALGDGLGFAIGIGSAYIGGWFDLIVQRILEIILAFPALILALLLLVAIGPGASTIVIAIGVSRIPDSARVVRSRVLAIKEEDYVQAARVVGAGPLRIAARHVAPQTVGLFLVIASVNLGFAVFAEAALSFLGVGIRPPTPTWGGMLGSQAGQFFNPAWWLVVFPGVAIVITVFAMNLLGDALRDFTDPRAAEQRKRK